MKTETTRRFCVEFWGVQFAVEWTKPELDQSMRALMLPNWTERPDLTPRAVFRISQDEEGQLRLDTPADTPQRIDKPSIVDTLERRLQLYLGNTTRQAVFVHAGVVGWQNGALVIPGRSYTGKSTLTLALLEAGATYYSDEYAIIDRDGMVHPFPRRLSLRQNSGQLKRVDPLAEGYAIGTGPLPLKAILSGSYQKGSTWQPTTISRGEGVLKLFANTVSAEAAPELAMDYLSKAVNDAICYESRRGEADEAASMLLNHPFAAKSNPR